MVVEEDDVVVVVVLDEVDDVDDVLVESLVCDFLAVLLALGLSSPASSSASTRRWSALYASMSVVLPARAGPMSVISQSGV